MREYGKPILEIILVDEQDVIRTSSFISPDESLGGGEDELPVIPWG